MHPHLTQAMKMVATAKFKKDMRTRTAPSIRDANDRMEWEGEEVLEIASSFSSAVVRTMENSLPFANPVLNLFQRLPVEEKDCRN